MTPPPNDKQQDGVSPAIKFLVIGLTALTVLAFSVFFFKLVGKVTSSPKETPWALQLQVVGDKLKDAGLNRQAIERYKEFLGHDGADLKTRSKVSQTLGKLYLELDDCRSALDWFYQAEVAGPAPADKKTLESQTATCLKIVQSEQP